MLSTIHQQLHSGYIKTGTISSRHSNTRLLKRVALLVSDIIVYSWKVHPHLSLLLKSMADTDSYREGAVKEGGDLV